MRHLGLLTLLVAVLLLAVVVSAKEVTVRKSPKAKAKAADDVDDVLESTNARIRDIEKRIQDALRNVDEMQRNIQERTRQHIETPLAQARSAGKGAADGESTKEAEPIPSAEAAGEASANATNPTGSEKAAPAEEPHGDL